MTAPTPNSPSGSSTPSSPGCAVIPGSSRAEGSAKPLSHARFYVIFALTLVTDWYSKHLVARAALDVNRTEVVNRFHIPLVGDLLYLQPTVNRGVSFGTTFDGVFLWLPFVLCAAAVAGAFWAIFSGKVFTSRRRMCLNVPLALISGGAAGNLADRIISAPHDGTGAVIDFIGYGNLFIGNVADLAIVVGAVIFAWRCWRPI